MKRLVIAAVAALGFTGAAQAADLAGTWTLKADLGPKLRYTLVCVLATNGEALSGPCVAVQGKPLATHGRAAGGRMNFSYSTDYNGSGVRLLYEGTVQPDHTVRGAVTANTTKGVFQGERLAASEADHTETWNLGVAFPGDIRYPVICAFKADGAALSGPCALTQGPTLHAEGSASGTAVQLAYDTEANGQPVHVAFSGAVQPDGSLKGSMDAGGAAGTFSASKP